MNYMRDWKTVPVHKTMHLQQHSKMSSSSLFNNHWTSLIIVRNTQMMTIIELFDTPPWHTKHRINWKHQASVASWHSDRQVTQQLMPKHWATNLPAVHELSHDFFQRYRLWSAYFLLSCCMAPPGIIPSGTVSIVVLGRGATLFQCIACALITRR